MFCVAAIFKCKLFVNLVSVLPVQSKYSIVYCATCGVQYSCGKSVIFSPSIIVIIIIIIIIEFFKVA